VKWASLAILALGLVSRLFAEGLKTIGDFRAAAAKANVVLSVPEWEQTPAAITTPMKDAIAKGNSELDRIGTQDFGEVTFRSTVVGLEDLWSEASLVANRAALIGETIPIRPCVRQPKMP
jgi:hypothetical protein